MDVFRQTVINVVCGAVVLLRDRTILALSILFGTALAGLLWLQSSQRSRLVESTAIQQAVRYSDAVAEFRSLYSSEVVKTATDHGLLVTHDYKDKAGAIPLPATLSMLLGNHLAEKHSGGLTRLYSPYPFPWRSKTGGLRDDFEREAWDALNKNPEKPFFRFEEIDGRPSLRYATADSMRRSCVHCHNTHPDTPKSDWKEGEVRGILEVDLPLDVAVAEANTEHREASFAVIGLFALGLTSIGIVVTRFRRTSSELEQQVAERTKEAQDRALELTHANAELTTTVSKLHESNSKLVHAGKVAETANQSKSEFLANMSHEIRTPMTAILGFTEILLDNLTKPKNIDAALTVKKNGNFLLNLINDILDLSKIEAEKLDVELTNCLVLEVVSDVAELMRTQAAAKGLLLEVQFDDSTPKSIQTDTARLRQILINILGNAIKFTETGSVQIVSRLLNEPDDEPKLLFQVIDTGIGITEEQIDKIFNPFTQADGSTTRRFGGTGLGLAISKRLVELLGGEIFVSSTIGKGSTFSFTVSTGPLLDVRRGYNTDEAVLEKAKTEAVDEMQAPLQNLRVLVAEDGPDNQRLIQFLLTKAGADVTLADNGQIAFDLAKTAAKENHPFDVILMDMQMPVLDGYEATRQLRKAGYSVPIIALTAHAMVSDAQKCLDAGCDDYETKPVDRKTLIQSIYVRTREQNKHILK